MDIAVIGSGITGLACAHELARHAGLHVTLFEAESRLGGHTNTVDATVGGITFPVDTGFLVYNERTYPGLIALFSELQVETAKSDMSFSVSLRDAQQRPTLEWSGTNLRTVFSQTSNLAHPRFWWMLKDILRFNKAATLIGEQDAALAHSLSLGDYLNREGYSQAFRDWYLIPMAAAIWSCPAREMLDYPLATFTRFCVNHGLLQVANRPQWYTVKGGARNYVQRIEAKLKANGHAVRVGDAVRAVTRVGASAHAPAGQVQVQAKHGVARFDQVVFACHPDQTLALIGDASTQENTQFDATLRRIRYQPNRAVLHTDVALMPARRMAWASWNFLGQTDAAAPHDARPVALTYWLNQLQPLPFTQPVLETLNPFVEPRKEHILAEFEFAHPVFDGPAIAAQKTLDTIQGHGNLWFAGAWAGYGFHEDGLQAGVGIAKKIIALQQSRAAQPELQAQLQPMSKPQSQSQAQSPQLLAA
jgi:uncharacterized protein